MGDDQQERIWQRIGAFVVSFQWLENKMREIGWFILDPRRKDWPPKALRKGSLESLLDDVEKLFLTAIKKCRLDKELEDEYLESFPMHIQRFHKLRRARNRILHSAYIEVKAGGEVLALVRSDPKLIVDSETGEISIDQETLTEQSFDKEFGELAELSMFFGRCELQLIHRYNG